MSHIHLSEEQLQSCALGILTDKELLGHLEICSHCQLQICAYQMLYSHIQEAEDPCLDFMPEALIPVNLPGYRVTKKQESWYWYGLLFIITGVFAALLIACWNEIAWLFAGAVTMALVLLLSGLLVMGLLELFHTYQKKINALNPG